MLLKTFKNQNQRFFEVLWIVKKLIDALDKLLIMELHSNHHLKKVDFEQKVLEAILQALGKYSVGVITKLKKQNAWFCILILICALDHWQVIFITKRINGIELCKMQDTIQLKCHENCSLKTLFHYSQKIKQ